MSGALELLRGREYEPSSDEVLRLASESKCSAYDSEFVAVANDLKVPLVTVDKQLLIGFPRRGGIVKDVYRITVRKLRHR